MRDIEREADDFASNLLTPGDLLCSSSTPMAPETVFCRSFCLKVLQLGHGVSHGRMRKSWTASINLVCAVTQATECVDLKNHVRRHQGLYQKIPDQD
jgi:hypothetical protein